MTRLAALLALLLVAGCAAKSAGPSADTGTIVGEVGDPRNRARTHTELASLYHERGNMANRFDSPFGGCQIRCR